MAHAPSMALLLATLTLAGFGTAQSQTMNGNSAAFNAGYGRAAGSENAPVNVQLTDSAGNLTVVNGHFQSAASGSIFAGGAIDTFTGAGGTASALGNNLSVVVQGDHNTVIVSSVQTNTGTVTATTTTNGKP